MQFMFQNSQSISGISGAGFGQLDLSMVNHNDSISKNQYTIKINAPQGHLQQPPPEKIMQTEFKKIATKNSYSPESTGYDINRQLFSDDDIRQAFNVIDINSDGCLTADELSFFLKCIDQPHTNQEVEEMVRMVSNDGKKVTPEDFKKIGRGKFPPFAAIKHPQPEEPLKQEILENIRQSLLSSLEPEDFFEIKQALEFSHQKYEEDKARREDYRETVLQPLVEENEGLKLRTGKQLRQKSEQYSSVVMLNVERAIQALRGLKVEVLELPQLAEALSISQLQAKMLFEKMRLSVREAIFDIILFSRGGNLHKLELILNGRSEALDLQQWVTVLCFMMGSQQRQFILKRLQGILKHRKIRLSAKFDRYFILQLMTEEYALFLW